MRLGAEVRMIVEEAKILGLTVQFDLANTIVQVYTSRQSNIFEKLLSRKIRQSRSANKKSRM